MTERFPFGPSTRPEIPLFPREQRVSPDRPAAVQGAKRPIGVRVTAAEAAELRELNRIGVNLNQMARALPQPLVLFFLGGVREWVERIGRKHEC